MNNTNQNHTDNFFKQVLSSPPEFSPSDKNWKEMERLLKPEAKRRSIAWIYPVSGIAAALLIFLSLWLVSDETATTAQPTELAKSAEKDTNPGSETSSNLNLDRSGNTGVQDSKISQDDRIDAKAPSIGRTLLSKIAKPITGYRLLITDHRLPITGHQLVTDHRSSVTSLNSARYLNMQASASNEFASQRNIEISNPPEKAVIADVDNTSTSDERAPGLTGKWALSLALSPDLNSVKGIDNGDFGLSMGMGVSYKLGKVLSVGTGIYYSQKLYSADKTSYKVTEKPFATWTSYSKKIDADCRVIDVPVNLSLRLSNKTQNKLYASAGLSSYIMLSEKYDFVYNPSPAYPTGHREYTVHNQNKHILSVVNLGIALEKPLADQVSLVIQPYAKLPLTGIGQGETDLRSFGVGFRLNYSLKKR